MKRLVLFSFIAALLLMSCDPKSLFKNKMTRCWKFSHMNNNEKDPQDPESKMLDSVYKRFHAGYLSLYDDEHYTYLGQNVSSVSHWSYNRIDSIVIIDSFIGGTQVRFKLVENTDEWLKMNLTGYGPHKIDAPDNTFLFAADPYFEYADIDLLLYSKNTWRIKPSHKENHAEIKKRVMAHVDFMISYYQMIEEDNRGSFRPSYLQSCLKFYANGIGMDGPDDINLGWTRCFYDEQDARTGYNMMGDAVEGMGAYPSGKSYTEQYYKALKMMKEFMEKVN